MKKVLNFVVMAFIMMAFAAPSMGQQTAFDENNQNRAIGIARSELSDCLRRLNDDGPDSDVYPQARGEVDADGNLTGNWTVAFFDSNRKVFNGTFFEDFLIAYVVIEDWEVVFVSSCNIPRNR